MSNFFLRILPSLGRAKEQEKFTPAESKPQIVAPPPISEVLPPSIEYSFREGVEGVLLKEAWERYISTEETLPKQVLFFDFVDVFISTYSNFTTTNAGHPSDVILNVANVFSRFLDAEPISRFSNPGECVVNTEQSFPTVKNVFIESNRLPVLSLIQAEAPGTPDLAELVGENEMDGNRAVLLRVLAMLSILLRYHHNRMIASYHLGTQFAVDIIRMMKFFSNKIEDLCLSWKSIRVSSMNLDEIISSDLLDDTAFVIRSLLLLIQLLAGGCPNVEETSSNISTFLPHQPWGMDKLEGLGFNLFDMSNLQREKAFSFKIFASDPAVISSMKAMQICPTHESWAQYLLNEGVVIATTELLRRITQFMEVFILHDSEFTLGNHDLGHIICSQWRDSKILQNEILFYLLSLATLNPEEFCPHFLSSEGANLLNIALLQVHSLRGCGVLATLLCYQTGVLCLRLTEILNQYLTKSTIDHKWRKHVLEEDTISSFFIWVTEAFPPEEDFLEHVSRSQFAHADKSIHLEEVIVAAVQLFDIPVSDDFKSDLWPWNSNTEGVTHHSTHLSINLTHRPLMINYRLCHPCSEQFQIDFSTKSTNSDWPNLLRIWSSFVDQILDPSQTSKPQVPLFPWFLLGKSALALHIIFDILFSTSLGRCKYFFGELTQSSDTKRNHISSNIFLVMKSVLSVLDKRNVDPLCEKIPLFEAQLLLFIARCFHCAPVHTIEACCEAPDIWSTLFSSKLFLGGRNEIQKVIKLNLRPTLPGESRPLCFVDDFQTLNKDYLLDPILRCWSSRNTTDPNYSRETLTGLIGYSWVCVHDFSLDLASMITSIVNHPPANRIVTIKRNFDIKPIIHALQESSENGDDSVTFQLLKWMSGYLDLLSARGSSIRNALSGQFFRAALAVCGYHLGDIRASAILQKEHTLDPIILANKTRPFMWISRRAAIELVIQVLGYSGCDRWLRLFSSVKNEKNPGDQSHELGESRGTPSLTKQTKSPAHVTLMLLFVDVQLRIALSFILSKVLFKLMTEASTGVQLNHADEGKQFKPREVAQNVETSPDSKLIPKANDGGIKYNKCICDLLVDLFELIKWSSRQPEWYNGSQVAVAILKSLTEMMRSHRSNISVTKDLQMWFRKGGILLEFVVCLNSCLLHADKWTENTKVEILHHGLALLTAIMSGDAKNKLEFRMVMMSKRASRSGSPLRSSNHSSPKGKKSSQVGIRLDDFIEMIVRTQTDVSLDTLLILFEMLLDGPNSNSKLCSLNFKESPQGITVGLFPEHSDRPQIYNLSVIPIIFGVMNQSSPVIQDFVLTSFHSLINGRASLINISNCSQMNPSMLDLVLDHFPSQTQEVQLVSVKLLQSLGKHCITVAQLKRIFQMMRTRSEFRPAYSTLLLKGLQGMVDENKRPRHSFVFDGVDSGIEIPSISRWPSSSAFTISLWIRVESPPQRDRSSDKKLNANEYRPFVLSMRCRNGHGFDISLRQSTTVATKFRVCIRSYGGAIDGDTFLLSPKLPVIEGQWHYLAVTMKSSSFRNHSEIEVMLDDQFVRHKLSFPKFNDVIEKPLLGSCVESFRDPGGVNTTLRGQMSAFYLFADALTEGQLRGIYGLGPSYFYSFESYSIVHRDITPPASRKQTVDPVLSVLDGSLSALIVLAYNPAVWKGDFCLDNTPERNQMRWKLPASNSDLLEKEQQSPALWGSYLSAHNPGQMNARILPGTYRSTTSDIRTALNSLGGVRVLLPLFAQFDQPRIQSPPHEAKRHFSSNMKVMTAVDTDLSAALFDLLRCFFVRTSENESLLRDFQGFALIGFFLERISPRHLTLHTLDLILKIRDSVSWNPTFSDDVLEYLLLNFKIWKFASVDVQQLLFEEIETILSCLDAKVIQSRNITTKLIDALYLLYDYDNPSLEVIRFSTNEIVPEYVDFIPRSSDSTVGSTTGDIFFHTESTESIYLADQWVHASSGLVDGVKLRGSQMKLARSAIFRILIQIISKGNGDGVILPDEIAYLVRSALLTSNSCSKAEILTLIIFFLSDYNTSRNSSIPQVLLGLVSSKGLLSLLPLISDPNKQVRLLTLLLFCVCVRQGSVFGDLSHLCSQSMKSEATNDILESELSTVDDHSMLDSQAEQHQSEESLDTLSMLGLPISSLIGITHHLQGEIMNYLNLEEDSDLINSQAQIIIQSLTLTLLGESCSHLMISILNLNEEGLENFFPFSELVKPGQGEKRADFSEPVICIPMVLPAIIAILKQSRISIAIRLSAMVDLRTYILHNSENCDHVLRIPAWQDYFFELIVEESSNLQRLEHSPQQNESQPKCIIKSKALVDTSLRTLCDIQFTAVRIGKPIAPSVMVSPQSRRNSELTVDQIFKETKAGERQLGVTVLQETMSFLRLYNRGKIGGVDMYPIGFDLLQQTVSALQRESDILLSQRKGPEDGSDLKLYFQNMLFLNIWLVGAIVLEFLTFPLGTKTEQLPAESIDHIHFLLSSVTSGNNESSLSLKRYEGSVWALIESLLRLMGPLGPMSENQLLIGTGEKGVTANQVGYLTGQKSLSFVDERINEIITKPIVSGNGRSSIQSTPLYQAAGGVCWIMVRLLFSVFAHGGIVENSMSISALLELKALVSFICDQHLDTFGLELSSIIGRLNAVLHITTLSIQSEWVKGALNLLIDLILIQRTHLLHLITKGKSRFRFPPANEIAKGSDQTTLGLVIFVQLLEKYSTKPEHSFKMSDILMDVVRTCLCLPDDFNFTWDMWSTLMSTVVDAANTMENELRREKLTDLGVHKHSEEVRIQLEQLRILDVQVFQDVFRQAGLAHASLRDFEMKRLSDKLRSLARNEKKIKLRWNQIVYQLVNERGPWGFPDDGMEIYWKLDQTESNSRMTHVLRRNEVGTSHKIATELVKRGKTGGTSNESVFEDSPIETQRHQLGSLSGNTNAYISPHGLWRDLMKYQKQSSTLVDNQIDPSDRTELEEGEEEPKETDVKKILFRTAVEIISKSTNSSGGSTHGILELTKHRLSFTRISEECLNFVNKTGNTEFLWACEHFPTTTWHTTEIWNVHFRKYQMRNVALEIFFTSRQVVFFNLFDPANQRVFYDTLRRQCKPPYLQPHCGYRPSSIVANTMHRPSSRTMTQAWINRNISNFEYLMFLNTVAGRSFNDMSQYPVFPWIIADYYSSKLNLTDPKSFRDLRWPMGAQEESQRETFIQRYQDLAESYNEALEERKRASDANGPLQSDCLPPFHYGSHYSTMGFVLWYLIREEPFTSLNIWMQDGRFDKPDRIFDTLETCWRGCTSNQADVKELIPEFFYNSDFLENTNRLDLGITTTSKLLGPVGLPPWAKNAQDFIRQNRNALESEYVSANLHHWIDLIFGYKQRPPHMGGSDAAVEACNVYFHLTYSGAVDLDNLKLNDPRLYNQMVRQIDNYGQTPTELFHRPHPARKPLDEVDLFWPIASQVLGIDTLPKGAKLPERPRRMVCFKEHKISLWPVVFIGEINSWEKLITVDTARIVATHFWQLRPPDVVPPFQFKPDASALKCSQGSTSGGFDMGSLRYTSNPKERRVGVPFAPEQLLKSDSTSDYSHRKITILANSKLIYEKEEAARSNWKMRSHMQSPAALKQSPEIKHLSKKFEAKEHEPEYQSKLTPADSPLVLTRVDEHITSHLFALLPDHRLLFSCGHWDNSFKVTLLDSGRLLQSISQHRDVVTCLDLVVDFGHIWLVTGSRDCTSIIWEIHPSLEQPIIQPPMHVLYGHDDAVNCVSVNPELDLVVSGSDDGTIIVHKLREGIYIRSIALTPQPTAGHSLEDHSSHFPTHSNSRSLFRSFLSSRRIHFLLVSSEGFIVAYDDTTLYSFSINGKFQAKKMIGDRLHAIRLSEDQKVIITGGERGLLVMRSVHSLELSNVGSKFEFESIIDGRSQDDNDQKPFASPIRSIYLTKQERHLIVGLENGEIRILTQDSDYLRKRLHHKLMEIGILEKMENKM